MKIEAYDLGEDGDTWMVEGTLSPDEADRAVRALWEEQNMTSENEEFLSLFFKPREDWYWVPVHEDYPNDDEELKHGTPPKGKENFTGVLVTT